VRELSGNEVSEAKGAGVNRIYWDMRYDPLPDSLLPGGGGRGSMAPFVMPGDYRVTLRADGRDATERTVRVVGDSLARITEADRKVWHDVSLALHQLQRIAAEAAQRISVLSAHLRTVQSLAGGSRSAPAALTSSVQSLDRRLVALRRQFAVPAPGEPAPSGRGGGAGGGGVAPVPNQLATVKGQLLASTSRPTEVQMRLAREGREDLLKAVEEINEIIATAMPAVYAALGQPQLQPVVAPMPGVAVRVP
jgi:hypothetical protein